MFELVYYDDGSDVGKVNGFIKCLIDDDKVDILVGGIIIGVIMLVVLLVEWVGILFILLVGVVVIVELVKKWVFKMLYIDCMVVEKVFEDMKKCGISKVVLFFEIFGFGVFGKKEIEVVVGKYGIIIVVNEIYGLKDIDISL